MPAIAFDRYYRYDDLTRLLNEYAAEYPQLIKVESIGKSHEGHQPRIAIFSWADCTRRGGLALL